MFMILFQIVCCMLHQSYVYLKSGKMFLIFISLDFDEVKKKSVLFFVA